MRPDPRPGRNCANCGKLRPLPARNDAAADSGSRMPRGLWLVSIERDPFCSAACCRAWHGTVIEDERPNCVDCGRVLSPARNTLAGPRCQVCSKKAARAAQPRSRQKPGECRGCGVALAEETVTPGCYQCADRERHRRRWRTDPAHREREKARRKKNYELKKARVKDSAAPPSHAETTSLVPVGDGAKGRPRTLQEAA